jgi:glycosyltransferase involved in cell wall biosynthesis
MSPTRLAIVCDYPEEGWPSMDLTGEMILAHLGRGHAGAVAATRVCPPFRPRLTHWPVVRRLGLARNADRLLNRFRDYPRYLARLAKRGEFDLFHVVDHSYAQLVHVLPPGRAVVTCHDLDTFRCLLDPPREPRPAWFRALVGHTLAGLRRAAAVVCNSEATRDALRAHALVPAERLHVILMGRHPECISTPDPAADLEAAQLLGSHDPQGSPELLHVGSTIPRKRIDVLLEVFAGIRRAHSGARLVRVGGPFTSAQEQHGRDLGVLDAVVTLPFLSHATLAAVYRRATLVLIPSETEGFGLPAAEALACGAPLLASDLPALREVAGDAAVYRPVADRSSWIEAALALLDERACHPDAWRARRNAGIARAERFDWSRHADQLVAVYRQVLCQKPAFFEENGFLPG